METLISLFELAFKARRYIKIDMCVNKFGKGILASIQAA